MTWADWSQQGLSLWGSRGLSLISPKLLITGGRPGHKGTSVHFPIINQWRSIIFRPFFLSLENSYRLTSHLKNFPKGFPGGVWNLRVNNSHISSNSLYQMSVHSNQTEPELHQPGVTLQMKQRERDAQKSKAKWQECPPKMVKLCAKIKSQIVNAKRDFPVPLDLWPGKVSILVSSDSFKQILVDFQWRSYTIISSFRSF